MHAVRGIAEQREARADIAAGKVQLQRPRLARAIERDGAELAAEALLDLGQEAGIVERQDARRLARLLGPGDAGAVAGQRQDGERPGRQKVLHGAAAVRAVVADGRDDARLRVAPADDLDAGASRRGDLRPSAATTSEAVISRPSASATRAPASSAVKPVASAGASMVMEGQALGLGAQRCG